MNAVEIVIQGRQGDIGDFTVNRILPYVKRRMVGPFIFLDHMGPITFPPGKGIDVKPHPHIGLATVTYLYQGTITHRDSLGYVQNINPGDVNWMTAGNGIVHSERTSPVLRAKEIQLHGTQTWIALPKEEEDVTPSFFHHPASTLPHWEMCGLTFNLIAGEAFGYTSPVQTFSKMFFINVESREEQELLIQDQLFGERAIYIVEGQITVAGKVFQNGNLIVFKNEHEIRVTLGKKTCCLLLGGESFEEKRFIWWNFVSSSREKIEQAKAKWKQQNFPPIPEETEFVPLPD